MDKESNSTALKQRIKFVLDVAEYNNVDTLILGAFGCGVFGQDPREVATIFNKELKTHNFNKIIFAIPSGHNDNYYWFNEILKGLKSEPSININKINWDNFGILYADFYEPVIRITIKVSKGKMHLKINPSAGYGGRVFLYHTRGENAPKENFEYNFNKKFEYELDVVYSAVAICMNLRTSLTKYIKGLKDGVIKAIDVKKDIENYIKDLK